MNIFYLDGDAAVAASYHCDQHVRKMIVECGQILAAAADRAKCYEPWMMKVAYRSHPCTIWVADHPNNAFYVGRLALYLREELTKRFPKNKHMEDTVNKAYDTALALIKDGKFTWLGIPVAKAMPDVCKVPGQPVTAYRQYYYYKNAQWVSEGKKPMTWAGSAVFPFKSI